MYNFHKPMDRGMYGGGLHYPTGLGSGYGLTSGLQRGPSTLSMYPGYSPDWGLGASGSGLLTRDPHRDYMSCAVSGGGGALPLSSAANYTASVTYGGMGGYSGPVLFPTKTGPGSPGPLCDSVPANLSLSLDQQKENSVLDSGSKSPGEFLIW